MLFYFFIFLFSYTFPINVNEDETPRPRHVFPALSLSLPWFSFIKTLVREKVSLRRGKKYLLLWLENRMSTVEPSLSVFSVAGLAPNSRENTLRCSSERHDCIDGGGVEKLADRFTTTATTDAAAVLAFRARTVVLHAVELHVSGGPPCTITNLLNFYRKKFSLFISIFFLLLLLLLFFFTSLLVANISVPKNVHRLQKICDLRGRLLRKGIQV
jgi:hypothetical protein